MLRHSLVQGWQWEGRGHPSCAELRLGSPSRSQPKYINYWKAIFWAHKQAKRGTARPPPPAHRLKSVKNPEEESNVDAFGKYLSLNKAGRGVTPPQSYPTGGFYLNNDDICRHSPSLSFYFNYKKIRIRGLTNFSGWATMSLCYVQR